LSQPAIDAATPIAFDFGFFPEFLGLFLYASIVLDITFDAMHDNLSLSFIYSPELGEQVLHSDSEPELEYEELDSESDEPESEGDSISESCFSCFE